MKSHANPPTVLPDDADSIVAQFYVDSGTPRVQFNFPGSTKSFNHALSEYNTLTAGQKTTLRTLLTALRDETFTLEGYT